MAFCIIWRGASGKSHTFEAYPVGTKFNSVSGVYVLCSQTIPERWEALYVGETQSFKQRLNEGAVSHDGYLRSVRLGMTHVAVLVETDHAERLHIETDLRHGLKPPANEQGLAGGFLQ